MARIGGRWRRGLRALRGLPALERRVAVLDIEHVWELFAEQEQRISQLERRVRITTVMAWIEQAWVPERALISVIVPTRGRAHVLPRAIESVLAQSYDRWELLVCADGDEGATEEAVSAIDDPRVRFLRGPRFRTGSMAARNRGLDVAEGELITYLDDDNRMHPNWLKSVAWAFEQRPRTEVLYAAIAIDDTARQLGVPGAELPSVWLEPYDRDALVRANVADTSAIAHRAGLPDARWDESIETIGDWDLLLRLTVNREPLTLPVIACFYYTDADGRLSAEEELLERDGAVVVDRAREARRIG